MRRTLSALALLVFPISAAAQTVTYTLTLGDNGTGTPTAGSFAVYAESTPADNAGIFGFGIDLAGATFNTFQNRAPGIIIETPSGSMQHVGLTTARVEAAVTGKASGLHNFADPAMVPVYGFGQVGGTLPRPPGIIIQSLGSGTAPYAAKLLVARGTYTGCPGFEATSPDNIASVWLNNTSRATEIANVQLRQESLVSLPCVTVHSLASMISTDVYQNRFLTDIQLGKVNIPIGGPQPTGSAKVSGVGDEAGTNFVMATLTGSEANITAALNAEPYSLGPETAQFKALQAQFGADFGGGFNALFAIPNAPGPKVFNWDFANFTGVAVDRLAVVPEPSAMLLLAVPAAVLLRRARRSLKS
jgi:hypothetical protein